MTLVLVVEAEESFSDPLSYMLRREGFEVAVCPTGPAALETFDRGGGDLVLLDLMLPGPPGTEVCQRLRERSDVPVIMLSARDNDADKELGLGTWRRRLCDQALHLTRASRTDPGRASPVIAIWLVLAWSARGRCGRRPLSGLDGGR